MAKERKRIEKKQIKPVTPKKRSVQMEPKPKEAKYVKVNIDDGQEAFKIMGDRVQRGEVKWDYYASGVHYYLILN